MTGERTGILLALVTVSSMLGRLPDRNIPRLARVLPASGRIRLSVAEHRPRSSTSFISQNKLPCLLLEAGPASPPVDVEIFTLDRAGHFPVIVRKAA